MKRIFRQILLFTALIMAVSCEDSEKGSVGALSVPEKLLLPRNEYSLDISTGMSVFLEWANSNTDNVYYQVLFDKEDGDFSDPVYVMTSSANGFNPMLEVDSKTMSTIASLCGGLPGQTISVRWTVKTFRGIESVLGTLDGKSRTIMVTRPNSVDPLPAAVSVSGTASEQEAGIRMSQALPVSDQLGKHIADKETGAFECFIKLSAGDLVISDDMDRYYILDENGVLRYNPEEPVSNTVTEAGIYWVYLNFNTMTWSMQEITSVNLWTHPWFGEEDTPKMTYEGNGVWVLSDYAWKVGTPEKKDTRYHFNVTYADGTIERWSFWDDDCRNNSNPEGDPKFFNVYRFTNLSDQWAHSWKSKNDSEGVGKLATFRIYMNNDKSASYYHERSFK